jgi:lactoylglutathione lyase
MKFSMAHTNINVRDLDTSLSFYENKEMGIYFIKEPDGYWLEIVPEKK